MYLISLVTYNLNYLFIHKQVNDCFTSLTYLFVPVEHWLFSVVDLWCAFGLLCCFPMTQTAVAPSDRLTCESVVFVREAVEQALELLALELEPEDDALLLLTDITEWGRLLTRKLSSEHVELEIELRNLGAAGKDK